MDNSEMAEVWENHATWWQETFTEGVDEEYEQQMLPLLKERLAGAKRVLDIGTGEGQVARMAAQLGATVVGIDYSMGQIVEADRRGDGPSYLRADAASLPFVDNYFEAAIACLVLEHIEDIQPVCAEVARVLQPSGRLLLFLNHPAFQTPESGWVDDHIMGEQYWRSGPYLREQISIEQVDVNVSIPFVHRTISGYLNSFADVGLLLTNMDELVPFPLEGFPEAQTIPRLMLMQLELLG